MTATAVRTAAARRRLGGGLAAVAGLAATAALLPAAWPRPARAQMAAAGQRVVTLGGTITEIVYALEAGDRLVGVDDSSLYPAAAKALPKVGYYRSFSVEGIASLRPNLILASDQSGPPAALERLKSLGIDLRILAAAPTLDALEARITGAAEALAAAPRGGALVASMRRDVAAATGQPHPARVLVLSSHTGRMLAAGSGTSADALLGLLGASNLGAAQAGFKPIAGEAVAALAPDVIITGPLSLGPGGLTAFRAQPGIAATPAARNGRIVVIDELLLLGFGPRVGEALRAIAAGLDGKAAAGGASRPASTS